MSHRLFAQLAFERALGNAAIEALATALNDKDHFDAESMWPKDPMSTAEQKSAIRRRKTRPSCYMPGGVA